MKSLEEIFAEYGPIACELPTRRYSCMYCNKSYELTDPDFAYYRAFPPRHWLVKAGLAREGDPMCLVAIDIPRRTAGGWNERSRFIGLDTLGWFSHCEDRDACAHRKANLERGQHGEALSLADELDRRSEELAVTKEALS